MWTNIRSAVRRSGERNRHRRNYEYLLHPYIRSAVRNANERHRHRRDYEFLLHQSDRMFDDIGVDRAEIEWRYRNT